MQNSRKSHHLIRDVSVLLFDDFSNHCLANTIEPLRAANDLSKRRLFSWQILTLDDAPVESSSGIRIAPDAALDLARGDLLVVMPSYNVRKLASLGYVAPLRSAARRFGCVAGFDTGSWLLAAAGLLDERRATIHWDELAQFEEHFPNVQTVKERFVMDGDRITCSGAMAAFDVVTQLIGVDHGASLALEVERFFMSRTDQGQMRVQGRLLRAAIAMMQDHLERPLKISHIAQEIGCSQRILAEVTQRELSMTPRALYQQLRLALAQKLVMQTRQSIAEIALRCGYQNASAMTRAFRMSFRTTPQELRRLG